MKLTKGQLNTLLESLILEFEYGFGDSFGEPDEKGNITAGGKSVADEIESVGGYSGLAQALGEELLSIISPPAGWAIDARDFSDAVKDVKESDGKDGKFNLFLCSLGFWPGLGIFKNMFKKIKGIFKKVPDDAVEDISKALSNSKKIKYNPYLVYNRVLSDNNVKYIHFQATDLGSPIVKGGKFNGHRITTINRYKPDLGKPATNLDIYLLNKNDDALMVSFKGQEEEFYDIVENTPGLLERIEKEAKKQRRAAENLDDFDLPAESLPDEISDPDILGVTPGGKPYTAKGTDPGYLKRQADAMRKRQAELDDFDLPDESPYITQSLDDFDLPDESLPFDSTMYDMEDFADTEMLDYTIVDTRRKPASSQDLDAEDLQDLAGRKQASKIIRTKSTRLIITNFPSGEFKRSNVKLRDGGANLEEFNFIDNFGDESILTIPDDVYKNAPPLSVLGNVLTGIYRQKKGLKPGKTPMDRNLKPEDYFYDYYIGTKFSGDAGSRPTGDLLKVPTGYLRGKNQVSSSKYLDEILSNMPDLQEKIKDIYDANDAVLKESHRFSLYEVSKIPLYDLIFS